MAKNAIVTEVTFKSNRNYNNVYIEKGIEIVIGDDTDVVSRQRTFSLHTYH